MPLDWIGGAYAGKKRQGWETGAAAVAKHQRLRFRPSEMVEGGKICFLSVHNSAVPPLNVK